ncbi:MAG: hypothetical protein Q4A00_04010 [Flavobacteriaceae bacterium]|nr:hypothetical protein [Flavobacteriaceae bacterium]
MATRYKNEEICIQWGESDDGYDRICEVYTTESVPIREWELNPSGINTHYTRGGAIPEFTLVVQFPELSEWNERNYDDVHYELVVQYQGNATNWLDFRSKDLRGLEFTKANIERSDVELIFRNLINLPVGTHTANIIVKAFEKRGSAKTFIENSPTLPVKIAIKGDSTTPAVNDPDYRARSLSYHKNTRVLSGDTAIVINDVSSFDFVEEHPYFSFQLSKTATQSTIQITAKPELQQLGVGVSAQSIRLMKRRGNFFVERRKFFRDIPITLNVMENNTPATFSVSPTDFSFSVSKDTAEVKEGTAAIMNPSNLNIQLGATPNFLERVRIENGALKFQTKSPTGLNVGAYSGEIVLRSGNITRRVQVALNVVNTLKSDFKGSAYYFALDKNKVSIERTNPLASYVEICLEMYYRGQGKEHREKQKYAQHYFQDKIEFYPGEEVQDFFIRQSAYSGVQLAQYQYHFAVVNIIIREFSAEDEQLSELRLDNIFFAPGKKPKCFPIFTDFCKRRTFSNSKIRLNTDVLSEKPSINALFEKYTETKPTLPRKFEVYAYHFDRDKFRSTEEKKILVASPLEFIPFPEPRGKKVVHLFFENQNLVLDWFSCAGEHQKKWDFQHITDEQTGEKFATLETETLVLNTGWILREEIELVNAIIKSRICFIVIDDEVIKARPMSKKNEIYNTAENLFSMDLEFNIKQNER